jgi:hypothetical protein
MFMHLESDDDDEAATNPGRIVGFMIQLKGKNCWCYDT